MILTHSDRAALHERLNALGATVRAQYPGQEASVLVAMGLAREILEGARQSEALPDGARRLGALASTTRGFSGPVAEALAAAAAGCAEILSSPHATMGRWTPLASAVVPVGR